jgi:hypothetical protein
MVPDRVDEAFRSCTSLRDPGGDPELEAVKAAILLEEAFDITLTDADIDPTLLGSALGVRSIVTRHGGAS